METKSTSVKTVSISVHVCVYDNNWLLFSNAMIKRLHDCVRK